MSFAQIVKGDFVRNVVDESKPIINEDRTKYKPFWEHTLNYCKTNNIIISDRLSLFKDKKIREVYNLYSMNPFRHSVQLANYLHEHTGEKLLSVMTVKENEEFTINIDSRALINIYVIQKYRKLDAVKLINPVEINGNKYIPPEIEIIEVYSDLYNPAKFGDWETLKNNDLELLYDKIIDRKKQGILGAGDCQRQRREYMDILKIDIIQKWIPEKEHVMLIGVWAYNLLTRGLKKICTDSEKIQIISDSDPISVLDSIRTELNIPHKIIVKEQDLHIPKDFRTKRYTFYLIIDESEKAFMDMFNSAAFELVPYHTHEKINIGDNYVILKFLFIDLWIVRLIEKLGIINTAVYTRKLNYLISIIDKVKNMKEVDRISYMGIFHDYAIDKKIFKMEHNSVYRVYYPDKQLRDTGTYWKL
jgi:hypothetical protein